MRTVAGPSLGTTPHLKDPQHFGSSPCARYHRLDAASHHSVVFSHSPTHLTNTKCHCLFGLLSLADPCLSTGIKHWTPASLCCHSEMALVLYTGQPVWGFTTESAAVRSKKTVWMPESAEYKLQLECTRQMADTDLNTYFTWHGASYLFLLCNPTQRKCCFLVWH